MKKLIFQFLVFNLFLNAQSSKDDINYKKGFDSANPYVEQTVIIRTDAKNFDEKNFISVKEYLKNNKESLIESQASDNDYNKLLDLQNQGISRNKPKNWDEKNSFQSIDNTSFEIDLNDIPKRLKKVSGDDILITATGSTPSLKIHESSGDMYIVYNTVNTAYSNYEMFYVYKSSDNGETWITVAGAFSAANAFSHPVIAVLKDKIIVSYTSNGNIGIYTKDISEVPSNPSFTFTTVSIPNKNNSAINDEVLWGSIITDKFYYDESATWTYLTYLTYDSTAQNLSIHYIVSYDLGVEWKTPVTIISENAWGMRYSISSGYTTPEPYTGVDFLWFTWKDDKKDVYATKVDIYKIQNTPSSAITNINLITKSDTREPVHGTVATYFDKIFITGMIYWSEGSKTSTNKNADLYMSFSDDGGVTWGTEDYRWYYWTDLLDKQEDRPVATYGTNGVLGFAWTYDGDFNYRTNSTGEFLQGWDPIITSDVDSDGNIFIASAIQDSTFHYAYNPYKDQGNAGIYYNSKNMSEAQKSSLSGYVTNALDGTPIANATVQIASFSTITDQEGFFEIKSIKPGYVNADFASNTQNVSLKQNPIVQFINLTTDGSQAINISATNFINYDGMLKLTAGTSHTFEYSLTPQLSKGEMRVVLNWGIMPQDLDGHLFTPEIFDKEYHVWWSDPGSERSAPFATLDHDDTLSYGPETITLTKQFSGTYSYYVTNYSRAVGLSDFNFGDSEASVSIYDDKGKVATISIPKGADSSDFNHWKVFTIDGATKNINLVNELTSSRPDLENNSISERSLSDVQARYMNKSDINKLIPFNSRRAKTSSNLYYIWSFGDGNTSTEESPYHTYESSGEFTVKLESTDGANYSSKTLENYIVVVSNVPPVATSLDTIRIGLRSTVTIDLDSVFTDADNDKLSYKVISSNVYVASPDISDNLLQITGVWPMVCTLIINANDGNDGEASIAVVVEVEGGLLGLENTTILPNEYELSEAYPNPFNPATTLRFALPEVSSVTLTIFNMLGQKIRTYDLQNTPAGHHSIKWNATNDYGDPVGAGVYLYQLQTKDFVKTRKMVLLK
jgi:PKD repeat protein